MALRRMGELARGQPLPAPIHGDDDEAARQRLADRLEIFLDEFGAAAENGERSARRARGAPARHAQIDAVDGARHRNDSAGRDGIVGRFDEAHGGLS